MSRQQDLRIVLTHLRNWFQTATKIAQETRNHNQERVSRSNVRRRLADAGLQVRTEETC